MHLDTCSWCWTEMINTLTPSLQNRWRDVIWKWETASEQVFTSTLCWATVSHFHHPSPVFLQVSLLRRDASVSGTEIFSPSSPARFAKACSFSASFHESRRMNSNVELCNTPWQINMEPKDRPLCEGKSSSRPLLLPSMLIFQCVPWDASRACFTLFLLWLRNA